MVLVLGIANIISGHMLALAERDLKRLLAFSSVAHVGYILVALSVVFVAETSAARQAAATAVLLHIAFHALIKSVLFYSGRSLVDRGGTSVLEGLRGVGRRELVGFGAFILASLALVGIPPTSGFYSKWRIALSAYGNFGVVPVAAIAAGTVISMLYYGRVYHLGLSPGGQGSLERPGASPWSLALVATLALATLVVGPLGPGVEAVLADAAATLGDPDRYLSLLRGGG